MIIPVVDAPTGWAFGYEVDRDGKHPVRGLVLKNITHDGHNFAKEIGLVGLRLQIDEVDDSETVKNSVSQFYPLDDVYFEIGEIAELRPTPIAHPKPKTGTFQFLRESDEALYLKSYFQVGQNHVACGLRCDYRLKDSELRHWPNAEHSGLSISQIVLFSRYASSPRHEPGGVLAAARCHPLVRFELLPASRTDRTKPRFRVRSIRFDYRLHLLLDRHHDVKENAKLAQYGNRAGLFRDNERLRPLGAVGGATNAVVTPINPLLRSDPGPEGVAGVIFAAVEKPLVLEVIAPGLTMGVSKYFDKSTNTVPKCWDNIHWWGDRGKGQPMISSPGAFHAAHIHWRWGTVGERIRFRHPTIDTVGTPSEIEDLGASSGALVDPRIWMQTIRAAVTRYEPSLDPAIKSTKLSDLCLSPWKDLFANLRLRPAVLDGSEDLVLWYSVEAHDEFVPDEVVSSKDYLHQMVVKKLRKKYFWAGSGTVFLHGIFFAHNSEPDAISRRGAQAGNRWSQYWPNSRRVILKNRNWFRGA